jgi:hypothetical protein
VDSVNLPLPHLIIGLLALVMLYLTANRTAFCVLRRSSIPLSAARFISGILSAAFFILYLFAGLVVYIAVFSPQRAEIVRTLLPPPQDMLPSAQPAPVPQQSQAPQGRMAAEENWAERRLRLAEMTEQVVRTMVEHRQAAAQEEQSYVVAEGISGTEDAYLPPDAAGLPETKITVQKPLTFADEISAYFNDTPPAARQQNLDSAPSAASAGQNRLTGSSGNTETAASLPSTTWQPQNQPAQPQTAATVPCSQIRMQMDAADMQIFRRAMRQQQGAPTSWKGPGGSYTVTPGAIKSACREYSIQANMQGRLLRCQASCASLDQAIESAALSASPPPRNDEAIILQSMNSRDQDTLINALTYSGPVSWRSTSGIFYTVSPVRLGKPCREYKVKANIDGQIYEYLESNCQ